MYIVLTNMSRVLDLMRRVSTAMEQCRRNSAPAPPAAARRWQALFL